MDSTDIELQVEELGTCFPSHFSTESYVFASSSLEKGVLGPVYHKQLLNTVCESSRHLLFQPHHYGVSIVYEKIIISETGN